MIPRKEVLNVVRCDEKKGCIGNDRDGHLLRHLSGGVHDVPRDPAFRPLELQKQPGLYLFSRLAHHHLHASRCRRGLVVQGNHQQVE